MKKKLVFTSVFIVTFLATLALLSLFPAHESFADGPTYYNLTDYWPMIQGSTWTYQETENGYTGSYTITIDGFEKVGGVKAAKRAEEDEYDLMSFDSGGLNECKWVVQSEGVYGVCDPPLNLLPAQMYVGQTHNSASVEKIYNRNGQLLRKANVTWSVTLEGLDNVTVSAGEFTCLKFSFFNSEEWLKGWSGTGTEEGTFWLASGVGEVKWVGVERVYDDQGQLVDEKSGMDELLSYSEPNDSILTTPNGGNLIPSGSTYPIEWTIFPEAASYKLKYSLNNGKKWKLIDSGEIIDTSYDWPVPIPRKNQTKCLMKVIGYDAFQKKLDADRSDWGFTIEVVKVTWPNGGETLTPGDISTITWTTNATKKQVAEVKLFYTKNGGKTWNKIDTLDGNPGSYGEWTVPDVPKVKRKCLFKVVLKDANGNTLGSDTSDSYFTIAERIEDDFNDGILDSSLWTSHGNENRYAIETNGHLEIRATGVEDDAAGVQLLGRLISVDEDFRVQVDFDSSECSLDSGIVLMVHNPTDWNHDFIFVGNGHEPDIVATRSWLAAKAINDEFVQTVTEPTTSNSGTLYIEHKGNLFYVSFTGYGADNAFATFTISGWTSCSQVLVGLWGFTRYQFLSGEGSYLDNFELVIGP